MFSTVTFSASGILLREGLEALLVITALAAYLTRINSQQRLHALWTGSGLGVVASIAMAWVFSRFYGGDHSDLLEGITLLIAASLMLYVSGWLFLKQNPKLWQSYLKGKVDKAVSSGSLLAVGSLAFLAIFREGAETALFINALAETNGGWTPALFMGLFIGTGVLASLFIILRTTALRLPLRPMFLATSALLFVMALNFAADAMQEFQEMGWFMYHDLPSLLRVGPFAEISMEAAALMLLVGMVAITGVLVAKLRTLSAEA